MDELQLLSRQQPGQVPIDNFQELKAALAAVLRRYEGMAYTEDRLADARAGKKELYGKLKALAGEKSSAL